MPTTIHKNMPVSAQLEILNAQIGSYAIDLWNDTDASGGFSNADTFLRRAKGLDDRRSGEVPLGMGAELSDKFVQFIWNVTRTDNDTNPTRVRITLRQGADVVPGFPTTVEAPFPDGENYGIFQTWFLLVVG